MWSLYENDVYLGPLVFSNGKTQEDVVNEIIESINSGCKIIFIKGVCGTGKSTIALNLAKEIGKASIVVPIKNLQKQYEEDYTNKKYLLKNNKKLKIKIITGRSNHQCPYLKENAQEFKIEKDSKLTDFDSKSNENDNFEMNLKINKFAEDFSCDNSQLPCKIELKEKNFEKIREYLKKNPKIDIADFVNVSIRRVRRMSVAPICQYWSPIVPSEIELGLEADCKYYLGLKNRKFTIYQRKKGCEYYGQFNAYLDSDAIIFNSQKYKLETLMDRKPATDIEIIDECDEFLDSFSNHKKINFNRLNFALGNLYPIDNKTGEIIDELIAITKDILKDKKIEEAILNEEIMSIKDTKIFNLLKNFLDYELMWFAECDEENYCYYADEVARTFDGFFDETYVSFYKEDKDIIARIVTTNLEKRFKELLDKNKTIVMMSGTIHSENVLRNIFGLNDFKIIDAETKTPGKITYLRTGLEINCKYENFLNKKITREQYLLALEKCIELAKKPTLVHVTAFRDLPTEQEVKQYNLKIMSREKLKYSQTKEGVGEQVKKFKNHEIEILYSTKCNRGVDFPGSTCNSIILTKYPYPDVQDLFWRILKKTKPLHYNDFYMDKAKREFLQRVYRGLRSKDDHIFLLSPDARVLNRHF